MRLAAAVLLSSLLLLCPSAASAWQTPDGLTDHVDYADGATGRVLVDGGWQLRLDPADQGVAEGWWQDAPATGDWQSVTVPHTYNADIGDPLVQGRVGWYRKDFDLPAALAGNRVVVRFESVAFHATVWLNGVRIGAHLGAHLPFELPADALRASGQNHLIVRVDPGGAPGEVATGGYAWWNYLGLLREVYLRPAGPVDLADMRALAQRRCSSSRACPARVTFRAQAVNASGAEQRAAVDVRVAGRTARTAVMLRPGERREVRLEVPIARPRLWSPRAPHLYRADASVSVPGFRPVGWSGHVGVRSLRVRRGILQLNGRSLRLHGVSVHEDFPGVGFAARAEHRAAEFGRVRALKANVIRAHYPLHPQTLEMADRAGVLVWDEAPVGWLTPEQFSDASVRSEALRYVRETVARDANHPSVFAFSVGNELENRGKPPREMARYVAAAHHLIHTEDPTRLSALGVAGEQMPRFRGSRITDILGVNVYLGWYYQRFTGAKHRRMLRNFLKRAVSVHRRQAVVISEFGAEANRAGSVRERGTYRFQSQLLANNLRVLRADRRVSGAIIWLLRDFPVRDGWVGGNPEPTSPYNFKGLTFRDGRPKPAFSVVRRLFEHWTS